MIKCQSHISFCPVFYNMFTLNYCLLSDLSHTQGTYMGLYNVCVRNMDMGGCHAHACTGHVCMYLTLWHWRAEVLLHLREKLISFFSPQRSKEDNGNLLQKVPCRHCFTHCPRPYSRQPPTHASAGDAWKFSGKFGSVSCWVTAPFFWVLAHARFCCDLQESVSSVLCKFWQPYCVTSCSSIVGLMVTSSKRAYAITRFTAMRAPAPTAVHCWPVLLQETLKYSFVSVSVDALGPDAHKVCLSPQRVSGGYGVWF